MTRLHEVGATVFGPEELDIHSGVVSFWYRDVHPHDLAQILNEEAVCIRAGHHCAQLVMRRFGTPATSRASFSVFNTKDEIDLLIDALATASEVFAV
jgi:cysteine desulfurase/selenocysteine lyase